MKVVVSLLALCALANTGYARHSHQTLDNIRHKPDVASIACVTKEKGV